MMATLPDILALDQKYNVVKLSVLQSHKISARTTLLIKHLSTPAEAEGDKPSLCCLRAQAHSANKLITIIEIAKRELSGKNIKVYQYNALSSEIIPFDTTMKHANGKVPSEEDGGDDGPDEDDAFQTMGQKDKIRAVPVLTVYVSTEPIKSLKHAYE
jgi:hypothetical protein